MYDAPERIVRRFAAAGNLVVSGQPTAVLGGDATAPLRELLVALGGDISEPGEALYVYADGDAGVSVGDGSALRDGVIVIECGRLPALRSDGLSEEPTRLPFRAYRRTDGTRVRVLPADAAETADAEARLDWARAFMPACTALAAELSASGVVRGVRIGISMVLEPKTATLALFLRDAGAEVVLYAHADETDPAIADALRRRGFPVHASGDTARQLADARAFLASGLDLLLDDGSHLIRLAAHDGVVLRGAAEETTSGLRPLRALGDRLTIPVVAVNDARMKTRFDNRYGTGQSCVFAIADLLERIGRGIGPTTAVIGFGPVGEGVAQYVRALGSHVVVVETDPVRMLEARHAGCPTMSREAALDIADLVISATGVAGTITPDDLRRAARRPGDRPVFAVAGGVTDEIELDAALASGGVIRAHAPKVDALVFDDGEVIVLDRGGCINITAAEGNPVQIMDYSFAAQLCAVRLLAEGAYPEPGVHALPPEVDDHIAALLVGFAPVNARVNARVHAPDEPATSWHPTRFPDLNRFAPEEPA
ncbi:adenosylhomocysteinase [Microbacterium gorillae]|uniref:adenosylhomocysteinase n=1 Tax=Microbacterium gorillae TaxID=1231063 RepID=UPI0006950838|nr:adenosylhomocysteinase [Microbacterium gorillae]